MHSTTAKTYWKVSEYEFRIKCKRQTSQNKCSFMLNISNFLH